MNLGKRLIYNNVIPVFGKLTIKKNQFINVIYYHDIVKSKGEGAQYTNFDLFIKQMNYLVMNGYETYRFDDLDAITMSFKKRKVLITFDDGWVSNYREIFKYMTKNNLKYNIFLAAGSIGTDDRFLTWEMVRHMYQSGIVGFGAHTYHHVKMDEITLKDIENEVTNTNRLISEKLGIEPADFCYPYGQYSKSSLEILCRYTNYKRIYTSDMMFSYMLNDRFIMGRNSINNDEPFEVFVNKLKGYYNCFNSIRRYR